MCIHDEWMKICVLCGDVLETTENKASTVSSAEMSKTVYVSAEHRVQSDGWVCTCDIPVLQEDNLGISCRICGKPTRR